jgi:hypothetical protein
MRRRAACYRYLELLVGILIVAIRELEEERLCAGLQGAAAAAAAALQDLRVPAVPPRLLTDQTQSFRNSVADPDSIGSVDPDPGGQK